MTLDLASPRRRRPRGETRRAQILDAATAVFLEHGYGGATIDLVVARAGASKATIYSFFGGKEGLFNAIVNERADTILSGFPDIEIAEADVRSALRDIARQYMSVLMSPDAVGLYRLVLAEGPRFHDLVESFFRVGPDRVNARLAKALRTWARHSRICTVDADRIATQFFDAVRGELHLRALAGLPPDDLGAAIEGNIRHAVRTFWRALRPEGS